jgi:hypothetical protein
VHGYGSQGSFFRVQNTEGLTLVGLFMEWREPLSLA